MVLTDEQIAEIDGLCDDAILLVEALKAEMAESERLRKINAALTAQERT